MGAIGRWYRYAAAPRPHTGLSAPDGASDFSDSVQVAFEPYRYETEMGTYAAEEITVAGRFARWEPEYLNLDVDAGDGRLMRISFGTFGRDATTSRDQAIALAELVIPRMATGAAPPPMACAKVSVEELAALSGLALTQAQAMSDTFCVYATADSQGAIWLGTVPGADPQTAVAGSDPPVELAPIDIAGRPAFSYTAPNMNGPGVVMDLDGLPGGDGHLLSVLVLGAPEGTDVLAIARQVAELYLSRM